MVVLAKEGNTVVEGGLKEVSDENIELGVDCKDREDGPVFQGGGDAFLIKDL